MESSTTPNPQYTEVTVEVPEDRLAEFHAFFARFLAGPTGGRRADGKDDTVVTVMATSAAAAPGARERAEQSDSSAEPTEI